MNSPGTRTARYKLIFAKAKQQEDEFFHGGYDYRFVTILTAIPRSVRLYRSKEFLVKSVSKWNRGTEL